MDPLLPAALVSAALGLALGAAPASATLLALTLFAATAVATGSLHFPVDMQRVALPGCWISIVASAASVHRPSKILATALACNAGLWLGCLIGTADVRMPLAGSAALVLIFLPVRQLHARLPVALKVVSSWLIAVAILAATLPFIPVTPGYQPDHIE